MANHATAPRNRLGRDYIARHGETVFNATRRLQGEHLHTPLTRAGFAQAEAMGAHLRQLLGPRPALTLWSSPTGRALQTLAVIAEHLELDWHKAQVDARLVEIGMGSWGGRSYDEVTAEVGSVIDAEARTLRPAPDGETYPEIAARVTSWLEATDDHDGDRLVIMHGVSSRVLRGVMTGTAPATTLGAPVAPGLPQGSIVRIAQGIEQVIHRGDGGGHA